jgi:pyrroline-5-carboxylate reductase
LAQFDSILILGCGNMGGAMLAGWLGGGMAPGRFAVVDPVLAEAPAGVRLLRAVPDQRFDLVLLGIKPQLLDEVVPALGRAVDEGTVLLSILAGVEIESLATRAPNAAAIVRVMPNLAAAVGKSPLGLFARGLDDARRAALDALLAPLGQPEWLDHEDQLDAVTALAGSGPAFVYRFIAALAAGGAGLGLGSARAQRLALATVEGAAALAAASLEDPTELARRVTSPGGTTAAGLAVLDEDAALVRLLTETLRAARDRGAELAAAART